MNVFIFVVGLRLALGVVGLALRVLALTACAAALVLAAQAVSAVLAVVAPPLARALTRSAVRLGRGGARVTRTHVGPAVLASCEWLGNHVIAAAGAVAGAVTDAAWRVLRRSPTGRGSGRLPFGS